MCHKTCLRHPGSYVSAFPHYSHSHCGQDLNRLIGSATMLSQRRGEASPPCSSVAVDPIFGLDSTQAELAYLIQCKSGMCYEGYKDLQACCLPQTGQFVGAYLWQQQQSVIYFLALHDGVSPCHLSQLLPT